MKNLLLALFFLFSLGNCLCQLQIIYGEPFDSLHKLADENLYTENFQTAARYYEQAFIAYDNHFPCILFYLDAFKACYRAGQIERSVQYLTTYASLGMLKDRHYEKLTQTEEFEALRQHALWPSILATVNTKRAAYGEIFRRLEQINISDQTLRLLLNCADENLQNDQQKAYLWELIGQIDEKNLAYVDSIVAIHGWLGMYKVGEEGSDAMWKVIQHSSLEVQERYLPMIHESVKNGSTSRAKLAFLEDRIRLYQGKYQFYGTQVVKDDDGHYKVFPIENPDEVDIRRAELGFEPLVEYLDFFDIKINSPADLQIDRLLEKWKKQDL